MKRFQITMATGMAMAALSMAVPSFANGPGSRSHVSARAHAGAPRAAAPVRIAPMRPSRLLSPRFGPGYGGFGYSHLNAHSAFGYDPFGWSGYGFAYGAPGYYASATAHLGGVRIKDAPRDAEVYVDDAYAGVVDAFDGRFQRLTLEPGSYRIDVRGATVSESVNVNVQPGRTTTVRARRP